MLITFSGLDGAGKTTAIRHVCAMLRARGREVVVLHMNRQMGVFGVLVLMRRWLLGDPEQQPSVRSRLSTAAAPGSRAAARLARIRYALLWNKPTRRLLYVIDLLIFLACRTYHERLRGRDLIMDRYFYDTLVDVVGPQHRSWLKVLQAITPEPGRAVLLDVSPEEAFARKGERTLEELRQRAARYRMIFNGLRNPIVLPSMSTDETASALERMLPDQAP